MNRHVLIMDADPIAAHVTAASVQRAMPQTTQAIAANVDEAMALVRERCPDLVIIDPPSQSDTVTTLIQTVKALRPTAQVVVLASAPSPTLRRAMGSLGVDVYIQKSAPIVPIMETLRTIDAGIETT